MKASPFLCSTVIILLLTLVSCTPARLVMNEELTHQSTVLPVKGRNGFQIGQQLSFGEYKTGRVRRGWTSGYEIPFRLRFQKAKEKLSYDLFSPEGAAAEVSCVSRFEQVDYQVVRDYFAIPLHYENFFAGNISLHEGKTNWDFVVYNPEGAVAGKQPSGFARSGDRRIDLVPLRKLEGQPDWLDPLTVYGYEFQMDGRVIGAVSLVNKGEVRLMEGAGEELKLVSAALATGLLLRHPM